jgi:hypothetical protein
VKILHRLECEKGIALVLAVAMLAILGILGAFALATSGIEAGISGNYRRSGEALHAADRAVEYGGVLICIDVASVNLIDTDQKHTGALQFGGSGLDHEAENVIEFVRTGTMPDGSGYGQDWAGRYFAISVTGQGADRRASARLEAQKVLRVPSHGNLGQELITTGGG